MVRKYQLTQISVRRWALRRRRLGVFEGLVAEAQDVGHGDAARPSIGVGHGDACFVCGVVIDLSRLIENGLREDVVGIGARRRARDWEQVLSIR